MSDKKLERFSEEQLVHLIVNGRKPTAARLLREFDCSAGRADVVYFKLRRDWQKSVRYGKLPARWVYALRMLPYRTTFSADAFGRLAGVTKKTAIQILREYEKGGYCEIASAKGFWRKVAQPSPIVSEIVAVEAKLRDWQRALSQACRYLDYANEAWVALDADRASSAVKSLDRFKKMNVGLYSMDKSGRRKVHFRPSRGNPKSALRFWEANAIIACAISGAGVNYREYTADNTR